MTPELPLLGEQVAAIVARNTATEVAIPGQFFNRSADGFGWRAAATGTGGSANQKTVPMGATRRGDGA